MAIQWFVLRKDTEEKMDDRSWGEAKNIEGTFKGGASIFIELYSL